MVPRSLTVGQLKARAGARMLTPADAPMIGKYALSTSTGDELRDESTLADLCQQDEMLVLAPRRDARSRPPQLGTFSSQPSARWQAEPPVVLSPARSTSLPELPTHQNGQGQPRYALNSYAASDSTVLTLSKKSADSQSTSPRRVTVNVPGGYLQAPAPRRAPIDSSIVKLEGEQLGEPQVVLALDAPVIDYDGTTVMSNKFRKPRMTIPSWGGRKAPRDSPSTAQPSPVLVAQPPAFPKNGTPSYAITTSKASKPSQQAQITQNQQALMSHEPERGWFFWAISAVCAAPRTALRCTDSRSNTVSHDLRISETARWPSRSTSSA